MKCILLTLSTLIALTTASGVDASSKSDEQSSATLQALRGTIFEDHSKCRRSCRCPEGSCSFDSCWKTCRCRGGHCNMPKCEFNCRCRDGGCSMPRCRRDCTCEGGGCDMSYCKSNCIMGSPSSNSDGSLNKSSSDIIEEMGYNDLEFDHDEDELEEAVAFSEA